ncbi:MAG: dihydropteroate synthase, partial [Firmicutes bacterium]|nr:dihydropteroate synthase [Bacillota bacterium]
AADRLNRSVVAAAHDAICSALCAQQGRPSYNDERMEYCQIMLEKGMELGMDPSDLWFDPLFLVIKGNQDKQMDVLDFIKQLSDMGFNSTGGLSNVSNMAPNELRPIMDSVTVAMAMYNGLTSAIVNPCDKRLMETIKTADIIKNEMMYADSYLEL